ncbi:unnamed protein product [Polarella glacialis]|uniref:Uncharacterized protein n=1 Tax=Polarella glacialis TaxID=89957 RepID=A0A813JK15_POLGL|nr:unnamed protein product [Polarella glacialis]CAE8679096.1 unnamed protein product [Polarella glacialis]
MATGASHSVSTRMGFKNLLELKRNSAQEIEEESFYSASATRVLPVIEGGMRSCMCVGASSMKRKYGSQSGAAIAPPSPEGGFPSSPEAAHTAGGQGSTGHVRSEPKDSIRVAAAQVPKDQASKALFQRSPSRLNDITPLKIQEHVELLENLAKRVVAKDMVVEGLTCLREALGPLQDKASRQFRHTPALPALTLK